MSTELTREMAEGVGKQVIFDRLLRTDFRLMNQTPHSQVRDSKTGFVEVFDKIIQSLPFFGRKVF